MELTHLDAQGNARMVDISDKQETRREAVAQSILCMQAETLALLRGGALPKGDAFAAARIAGIFAAKRTDELIPLCHPLPLSSVTVDFSFPDDTHVRIVSRVTNCYKTGVEMEALTACSLAALTLYDMAKAVDRGMVVESTCLLQKSGGRSGLYRREGYTE